MVSINFFGEHHQLKILCSICFVLCAKIPRPYKKDEVSISCYHLYSPTTHIACLNKYSIHYSCNTPVRLTGTTPSKPTLSSTGSSKMYSYLFPLTPLIFRQFSVSYQQILLLLFYAFISYLKLSFIISFTFRFVNLLLYLFTISLTIA